MTSPAVRIPKYSHHKASGQAVVQLCGRDFYLGKYGTAASLEKYHRLVTEWQANHRQLTDHWLQRPLTVSELIVAYWTYAKWSVRADPAARTVFL